MYPKKGRASPEGEAAGPGEKGGEDEDLIHEGEHRLDAGDDGDAAAEAPDEAEVGLGEGEAPPVGEEGICNRRRICGRAYAADLPCPICRTSW